MKAPYGDIALQRVLYTEGKSWLVCQREEDGPNDVYTVTVKTDRTKTGQSKRNNDLFSFELHLIIDFILTERKLANYAREALSLLVVVGRL